MTVRARIWVSKAGGLSFMDVIEEAVGKVRLLRLSGRFDHATVQEFEGRLLPRLDDCHDGGEDSVAVVLDLSEVEYMSSVGLRVLTLAAKKCKPQNGVIAVAALGEQMREIFHISRFDMIFAVYDDRASAVAALTGAGT